MQCVDIYNYHKFYRLPLSRATKLMGFDNSWIFPPAQKDRCVVAINVVEKVEYRNSNAFNSNTVKELLWEIENIHPRFRGVDNSKQFPANSCYHHDGDIT